RVESSLWFYRSFLLECQGRTHPTGRVEVPTGIAVYPKEMLNGRPPRTWAERDYHLVHSSLMQRGGHFACLEHPETFARDAREFLRPHIRETGDSEWAWALPREPRAGWAPP